MHSYTGNAVSTPALLLRFLPILAIAVLAYWPGLYGGFLFDDYPNLVDNPNVKLERLDGISLRRVLHSGIVPAGSRPASMLSFGLNYYLAGGFDPFAFKLVNLGLHLLNGTVLLLLSRCLLMMYRHTARAELDDRRIAHISLAVAALWLWHPLNLTSVLYAVQRMTSLSALFTFGALLCFCRGRLLLLEGRNIRRGRGLMLASLLLIPAAYFSKENGVLIPLFFGVIEFCLGRMAVARSEQRTFLYGFVGCAVVLPLALGLVGAGIRFDALVAGFVNRDFTWPQRLLTESRVLLHYLHWLLVPNIAALGLHHDDIPVSRGLLVPWTTLPAMLVVLGAVFAAFRLRGRLPLVSLAVLGFLAGHGLESSFLPLDLAYEHRNYVPAIFILPVLVFYAGQTLRAASNPGLLTILAGVLLLGLPLATGLRAMTWGNPMDLIIAEAIHHPDSAMTQFDAGRLYDEVLLRSPNRDPKDYQGTKRFFERSLENDPNFLAALFGLLTLSYHAERAPDPQWMEMLVRRLRDGPLYQSSIGSLIAFSDCEESGRCKLPPAEMGRLFQATIDNPRLQGASRAKILACASHFLYAVVRNGADALRLASWAVESDPYEVHYRIQLISLLILKGDSRAAREQIEAARQQDSLKLYADRLAQLEAAL